MCRALKSVGTKRQNNTPAQGCPGKRHSSATKIGTQEFFQSEVHEPSSFLKFFIIVSHNSEYVNRLGVLFLFFAVKRQKSSPKGLPHADFPQSGDTHRENGVPMNDIFVGFPAVGALYVLFRAAKSTKRINQSLILLKIKKSTKPNDLVPDKTYRNNLNRTALIRRQFLPVLQPASMPDRTLHP